MKRVSRERLEPALKLHKNMNYNMIRNWTGESTEEVFYELCDEYGMLVMNDFWLSTDGFNLNPLDNCLFIKNVTETVRRFRNHPSIALWCARCCWARPPSSSPRSFTRPSSSGSLTSSSSMLIPSSPNNEAGRRMHSAQGF